MPKRTSSIFKPKSRYKRKFKSSKQQTVKPVKQIPPGTRIYATLNQITSMLSQMNGLLYGAMEPANDFMKDYLRRAAMELHSLQKLLVDKLPDNYSKDDAEVAEHVNNEISAALRDIDFKLGNTWMFESHASVTSVQNRLESELTNLGLMPALRELSIGRSTRSKSYISLLGGMKKACRRLTDYWRDVRTQICNNNKHDAEEYRELKSALGDDLEEAYIFIESLKNNN